MNYCKLGQEIRRIRKSRGYSQEALAEKINISITHMSHIETGSTKLSLEVFVDIANALDVRTDELLKGQIKTADIDSINDIEEIFNSCTEKEIKIITDTVKTIKLSMDKYL